MTVFEYEDYKKALRALTELRRTQFGSRYTFEKVAAACGIQKTYLSRVLNAKGDLNADQLFAACEFLKLTEKETEYMEVTRELSLSTHPRRSAGLRKRLKEIRQENLKTESVLKVSTVADSEQTWEYYSDYHLHLSHLFLTIPKYATHPEKIAPVLGLDPSELERILWKLRNWGLAVQKKSGLEAKIPNQHLPEDSPAFKTFALLQRLKTVEKLSQPKKQNDYFFSVLFSARTDYQNKLRRQLLQLLNESRGQVEKSDPEEVYQLNIDLFRWS